MHIDDFTVNKEVKGNGEDRWKISNVMANEKKIYIEIDLEPKVEEGELIEDI